MILFVKVYSYYILSPGTTVQATCMLSNGQPIFALTSNSHKHYKEYLLHEKSLSRKH